MVVMNASLQIAIYAIALNAQIRTMKICIMQRRMKKVQFRSNKLTFTGGCRIEDILNKCPVCGSKLEYHSLYQFSKIYKILKNGKLSARPQRNESACPMECGFIACSNADCDFHTNCDLEVEEDRKYSIYQTGEVYKIIVR